MATMMGKQLALLVTGPVPAISAESPRAIPLHSFRRIGVSARIMSGYLRDCLN